MCLRAYFYDYESMISNFQALPICETAFTITYVCVSRQQLLFRFDLYSGYIEEETQLRFVSRIVVTQYRKHFLLLATNHHLDNNAHNQICKSNFNVEKGCPRRILPLYVRTDILFKNRIAIYGGS